MSAFPLPGAFTFGVAAVAEVEGLEVLVGAGEVAISAKDGVLGVGDGRDGALPVGAG